AAAAAKQLAEELGKVGIYRLERMLEPFTRTLFDLTQSFLRSRDRVDDVLLLRGEKDVSLFGLGEFVNGEHVDRAEILEPLAQIVSLSSRCIEIKVLGQLFSLDQLRQENVQLLRAAFRYVLKTCLRLGLTDLDLAAFVTSVGDNMIEVA